MARFRGTVKGQRGGASRLGSPKSGLSMRADGWEAGVRVEAAVDDTGDVFFIYATSGSNARNGERLVATVRPGDVGPVVEL